MKIWLEIEKHGEERYESLTPYKHGIRRTRIKKKNYYVIAYVFNKIEFFFYEIQTVELRTQIRLRRRREEPQFSSFTSVFPRFSLKWFATVDEIIVFRSRNLCDGVRSQSGSRLHQYRQVCRSVCLLGRIGRF